MSQAAIGHFSEELVRNVSSSRNEPSWLTDFRLSAFREFASLPEEVNPLYTKYSKIAAFDIGKFGLVDTPQKADLRSYFQDYLTGTESNISLQANEAHLHTDLDADLAEAGVQLLPIHEALASDEALAKKALTSSLTGQSKDRYAAFVNAFFNSGTIVRVPRGFEAKKPLRRMVLLDSPSSAIVEKTIILAEEQSKLTFLEEFYSKGQATPAFVASTAEVHAMPASHVDFSSIQLLGPDTVHVSNRAIQTLNDAHVTVSSLSLGAAVSRSRMNFLLDGRGSVAEGFEIFFTSGKQRYDFETNLLHNSPDSTGSTQARGVLREESQSIFKGMIKIVKGAKNSRSYLAHHAMILDRTAKSDGIPGLEIDNNEVKATHSASVAQIDEEQLFYLMARGLSYDEARKMVVLGFFEPVLSRVPVETTREGARFMVEGKWQGENRRLSDRAAMLARTGESPPEARPTEDIFERHYKYR